jgi:hypothetical protein
MLDYMPRIPSVRSQHAKELNVCVSCFSRPRVPNKSQCEICRESINNWRGRNQFYQFDRKYGCGEEAYTNMYTEQGGKCALCHRPGSKIAEGACRSKTLQIDHCHSTKKVRGLLCFDCNVTIGRYDEDMLLLAKVVLNAVEYLKKAG